MNLRILLVSDHYPPFIGGAHRQTQLLGRELRRRGHHVEVVTSWHPGIPEEEDDDGVHVHRLKELRTLIPTLIRDHGQRFHPPYPDPITTWRMRRVIMRMRPDVVHSYGWITYSCAAALLGTRIPLLVSARDYAPGCTTRTLIHKGQHLCSGPSIRKCLACAAHYYGAPKGYAAVLGVFGSRGLLRRKITGIHSISTFVQQVFRRDFLRQPGFRTGIGAQPIIEAIIPSFRESEKEGTITFDMNIKPYLDQLPKEPFILFVGALRRVKGIDQLLAAYTRLSPNLPLVLIGTVERDTPSVFPPGVIVLQNFPHQAVMAAWERCLFGVVPSLWPEPLGSVVYEGMSKGKAVIGTRPGGHTDMIVPEVTGLLVPAGDVEALKNAMQRLIEDRELCLKLGQAAQERARMFTADINVPKFEQLYQQLIANSGSHVSHRAISA